MKFLRQDFSRRRRIFHKAIMFPPPLIGGARILPLKKEENSMKKFVAMLTVLMLTLFFSVGVSEAAKSKISEQQAEINRMSRETLQRLYAKEPSAERVIKKSYAYATLSNAGVKVLLVGSSHGRGLAVNNKTGEKVYLKMKEMDAGLGIGAKEYDLVFVITNKAAWDSFIVGKTRFGGSVEAAAKDGIAGGAIEGASIAAEGVYVYQMTTKGLSIDVSMKGTKIYADKKLNKLD